MRCVVLCFIFALEKQNKMQKRNLILSIIKGYENQLPVADNLKSIWLKQQINEAHKALATVVIYS